MTHTRGRAISPSGQNSFAGGRTLGTLQVDVDDLWVYFESLGRQAPAGTPPLAYREGVPRLLDLFDRYRIRATFFVCGCDLPAQVEGVAEIARRGHEVANHSNLHQNGYARLSYAEKRADITTAGEAIQQATGHRPVGFKAPVFSFSADLLQALAELGYEYDSSLWPTSMRRHCGFCSEFSQEAVLTPITTGMS